MLSHPLYQHTETLLYLHHSHHKFFHNPTIEHQAQAFYPKQPYLQVMLLLYATNEYKSFQVYIFQAVSL
jgi:hypothetical protein